MAVEGNRRLAALKKLHREIADGTVRDDGIDQAYLDKLRGGVERLHVLLYKGSETDIAWILQGIRHISGIKDWEPAQRARLVAQQKEDGDLSFKQVGQKFGLSAQAVGRLYRAYKALKQMEDDDEYGAKAQHNHFTLFEEALKNPKVREWMRWDDNAYRFTDTDRARQFYSWMLPDEEHNDDRRLHDPRHVRFLSQLLEKNREDLIAQVGRHDLGIEEAWGQAAASPGAYDWQKEVDKAMRAVDSIPNHVFRQHPNELREALVALRSVIDDTLQRLN